MSGSSECQRCETAVPDGALFCHICGEEVGGDSALDAHARLRERLAQALGDHYRVVDLLGVGGMGVVFLADDLEHGRKVAIKVLSPEQAVDEKVVARFAREAATAAALEHPGIVRIYGSGSARGLHYFVMEYVEGRSLQELLHEEPRVPIPLAMRILREAAAALAHAHRHGVVHRDVKPGNIMLGAGGRVLLADFGISKMSRATSAATTLAKLTETGGVLGTPHYMAPEHALGQAADGRADQYSLAVVGFQMLAGKVPFDDDTSAAIIHLHINSAAPRLSLLRPDTPPQLVTALARAMSKAPTHRFASMEEFAAAVGQPAGRPVLASAASWMLALLLVGGLAGGTWWIRNQNASAPAARAAAPTPVTQRQTAKLSITSTPNATVFIDGKRIGVTPIVGHTLRSGTYQIRLERKGFRTRRETISITAPRALRRSFELQRARD